MRRRAWMVVTLLGAVASAGAVIASDSPRPEQLYLAMEIEREGAVVARPMLVGETDRELRMSLIDPSRPDRPRLSVDLLPHGEGKAYRVSIRVSTPERATPASGELAICHGEQRSVVLSEASQPLTVRLMLMRVDSPEFRALMRLGRAMRMS